MTCTLCGGQGVFRVNYREPDQESPAFDLAVCLCHAGKNLRARGRETAVEAVAGKYGHPRGHVGLAEELLDREDIPSGLLPPVQTVEVAEAGARHGKHRL